MSEKFFSRLDKIDQIINRGPEACDVVNELEPLIKEESSKKYFLDHLDDPSWINVLERAGMFRQVREPYLESRYLLRMADIDPKTVLEIVMKMPDTNNTYVQIDFTEIALKIPAHMSVRFASKVINWAKSPQGFILPEKLGEFMAHLANNGF